MNSTPKHTPQPDDLITTQAGLEALVERLRPSRYLALDTEFHREKTYFPQLCLIQVADDHTVAAIDPMAGLDLSSFLALLLEPERVKVFHAARQDLEIFYQLTGQVLAPLFDTQIAAMALGLGDQISYVNAVQSLLGQRLSKAQQMTDWTRRPLRAEQLAYALDDVIYLRHIYKQMDAQLTELGRLSWLKEEESRMLNPESFEPDKDSLWRSIRIRDKSPRTFTALRELSFWRDNLARAIDRPRHFVLKDDALAALAQQRPTDDGQLSHVRMLGKEFVNKHGDEILALMQQVNNLPNNKLARPPKTRRPANAPDNLAITLAGIVLKHKAQEAGITPRLIGNTDDLESFLCGEASPLSQGWRYDLVGAELEQLMAGDLLLGMYKGKLKTVQA